MNKPGPDYVRKVVLDLASQQETVAHLRRQLCEEIDTLNKIRENVEKLYQPALSKGFQFIQPVGSDVFFLLFDQESGALDSCEIVSSLSTILEEIDLEEIDD